MTSFIAVYNVLEGINGQCIFIDSNLIMSNWLIKERIPFMS